MKECYLCLLLQHNFQIGPRYAGSDQLPPAIAKQRIQTGQLVHVQVVRLFSRQSIGRDVLLSSDMWSQDLSDAVCALRAI
eukprot:1157643-Pelagomonas_calceolata.AAC.2